MPKFLIVMYICGIFATVNVLRGRVKWGYLGQFWVFSNFTLSLLDNMYI